MSAITGRFYLDEPWNRGPAVVLEIVNDSDDDVQVFLPNGRADGVAVTGPPETDSYRVSPFELPAESLVAATRLPAGTKASGRYDLGEWFDVEGVRAFRLLCAATIEYRLRANPDTPQLIEVESEVMIGDTET